MGTIRKRYPRERFYSYYLKNAKRKKYQRFECIRMIKAINNMAMEYIYKGGEYIFPLRFGSLSIVGLHYTHFFRGDKLIPVKPVNWPETLKLWEEDEYAKKKKQLVFFTDDYIYKFLYKRHPQGLVQFWPMKIEACRQRKKELAKLIKENKLFVQTKEF